MSEFEEKLKKVTDRLNKLPDEVHCRSAIGRSVISVRSPLLYSKIFQEKLKHPLMINTELKVVLQVGRGGRYTQMVSMERIQPPSLQNEVFYYLLYRNETGEKPKVCSTPLFREIVNGNGFNPEGIRWWNLAENAQIEDINRVKVLVDFIYKNKKETSYSSGGVSKVPGDLE